MAFGYQILGFGAGGAGGPPYNIQYLVVAGGGSGSDFGYGGGGGAGGGYRTLASKSFEVVPGKNYTVTIGAGGTGQAAPNCGYGTKGSDSVFDTITSTGGGGGAGVNFAPGCVPFTCQSLAAGGSGGGGGAYFRTTYLAPEAGTGNTPPVSPSQGYDGGLAASNGPPGDGNPSGRHGGGGGGAGAVGGNATTGSPGAGGSGAASCISGSSVTRAAGGAGDSQGSGNPSPNQPANSGDGSVGTISPIGAGGSGGSGVVIIRRATADSSTTSGTVTTSGDDTIHSFTSPGTFQG